MTDRAMTNLLIISGFWPNASNPISGIFVVQQIAALSRAGCNVTVLVGNEIGKGVRHLAPKELGLSEGVGLVEVPIFRVPEALSSNRLMFWLNVRSIGLSVSRAVASLPLDKAMPDGCIVHGLRYYVISTKFWSRQIGAKKIAFVHGVDPFLLRKPISDLVIPYIHEANDFMSAFALVGSPLRRHARSLGIDATKTVVIPNGTEIPDLPLNTPPHGNFLNVASVSNLIAWKGIDDNIRALRLLKEQHGISAWRYTVVGDGPERERLQALVASLGLGEQVQFLGRLSYDDTMQEIAKADIFSLPSWGEAFGIVYLEAMARMRPTIGCLGNGAADIITDGKDGILVSPKDPESLALAFKRLFEEPGLREEFGRQARQTAEGFSWDVNARRVLDALGLQVGHRAFSKFSFGSEDISSC